MSIKSQIESLLFISAKPMSIKELSVLIKKTAEEVQTASDELIEIYKKENRGIQIIKNNSKYQMVSSPENAKLITDYIKDETSGELTPPSLETLTIIAYREPIAKMDLDRIRGVNCSLILRNLLMRGLIEAKIDKKIGETYYNVSFDFIRFLGINNIKELPDYDRLSEDDTIERILASNDNKGK
ncbi:SMC-Scp complex subunit ScpB [Candidatus Falkowbacteria bacterium CG_4_9_14_3_um_filter_36_9]|uniref:SMC-Scp complex subunit ScpB n=1 Tax=Candidatus Falkowbacteria bacterium CG02_land_8_20_14_3_00_36_14 TaxID=1974560 RepID=A0A2M7DMF3_9BACT|nr:MAG: SMC-Scp complex subunit ScpB [Candidatus Falkowbacteria bacterium CG02_land_8_20_14_3_00_36_14]PIX10785.1 MAG: SMC-Scp complex subunit ScpB [Candidatus Falkowbacteria bacterium CG_4_8_14_3_um_filter_36_11]PJA11084.1 MAG: SMC-Scp complex subunit ScpB [Candidatus Falkowbacteria bacterium CG_4_10_14_0_2_um_filter_36_22]PJB19644.1 MAG: SMC-Scp complex subunit ScpB [Candidatus Falkowbacteria bacterium CG_4_9_14_3_um_filter_36_9]